MLHATLKRSQGACSQCKDDANRSIVLRDDISTRLIEALDHNFSKPSYVDEICGCSRCSSQSENNPRCSSPTGPFGCKIYVLQKLGIFHFLKNGSPANPWTILCAYPWHICYLFLLTRLGFNLVFEGKNVHFYSLTKYWQWFCPIEIWS